MQAPYYTSQKPGHSQSAESAMVLCNRENEGNISGILEKNL